MPDVHGLGSCIRRPLAVGLGTWRVGSPDSTLALSARSGPYLFLGLLLPDLPDPRADRPRRHPARKRLSASGSAFAWPRTLLVCANAVVVFERAADADVSLLGRHGGIAAARFECLAPWNAGNLFRMFSVIRECRGRFLWLPVRRHAAGSRIHRAFLRSAGLSSGIGGKVAAVSRQPVPAAVGVVPHLLRIRHGQDRKRRAAVAEHDRHGRVLPERTITHLGRLVRTASAALVSCLDGIRHACAGTGLSLDAVSTQTLADRVLLHRNRMADRHYPHRQLYVFELPGPCVGLPAIG